MTRTLCLLRHAKSSWDDPAQDDHDRPLAPRGREAAPRIGAWLEEHAPRVDLVLCSSAARASETWALVQPSLGYRPDVRELGDLYHAGPAELLEIVRDAPDEAGMITVVGHNPALEDFAEELVGDGDPKLRRRMKRKFPTAALALITFETRRWQEVAPGTGTLAAFTRPKDLQ